ncbi:Pbp4p Ecym_2775 [Eremothecium cymbalariae DBVPG|uniref:Uncharacterized protein n=1 Tax=Eremothecium cymbalariae (strain CBS 270.75 / DBVPG 7215 / KCTC 17166 / NRRL Y-17582) TaxID=931890 RepID=G8JQ11_ERECY|nr:Hypothetical protein Ecym_2775 [Eremothecium cymbalariae DBVPG\
MVQVPPRPKLTGWAAAASAKRYSVATPSARTTGGTSSKHSKNHNGGNGSSYGGGGGGGGHNSLNATMSSSSSSGSAASLVATGTGPATEQDSIGASNLPGKDDKDTKDCKEKKARKTQRASFNAQEVETFLQEHFKQHARIASEYSATSRSVSWDTNTSSKWKSKRYGCLTEVARALRS